VHRREHSGAARPALVVPTQWLTNSIGQHEKMKSVGEGLTYSSLVVYIGEERALSHELAGCAY